MKGLCLALISLILITNNVQAKDFEARIESVKIKTKMLVGRTYTAKVSIKNTGASTWNSAHRIKLVTTGNAKNAWKYKVGILGDRERIAPGDIKKFEIKLTAPDRTGIYGIQFQVMHGGNTVSSNSKAKMVVVENRSNRVKFISQLLPETMETNQEYSVMIQFKNNGSSTWTRKKNFKLGLKTGRNIWNTTIVNMVRSMVVPPGEVVTFQFNLKAPAKAGVYNIQWQMKKGNVWFGEPTPKLKVEVNEPKSSSGAEFIYQNVPGVQKIGKLFTVMNRGDIYPVSVTFKNTSQEDWTSGHFSLSAQNPPASLTWSVDRVELKNNDVIKPNEIKSFSFKIIAPLQPGIYNFQWQMLKGFNNWIGEKSDNISITVK